MLELKNISKSYNGFPALKSVSLKVHPGQIHGLVGVNGSGKSTLCHILSGQSVIHDTGGFEGELWFENKQRCFISPGQAISAGIGMVHQEFALLSGLNVSENISLAKEKTFHWTRRLLGKDLACIDTFENKVNGAALLRKLGIDLDPELAAGSLPVSVKQFVELARELNRNRLKLLLLDEPTAALGTDDANRLMAAVRTAAQTGMAIIYISHRLEEVVSLCDRVTILRNGKIADSVSGEQSNVKQLSLLMTGTRVEKTKRLPTDTAQVPAVRLSGFKSAKPGDAIKSLDLTIFKGEILGVTSLSGHGRSALGPGLMGIYPSEGKIRLNDRLVRSVQPLEMIRRGFWMVPEDRRTEGLLPDHSVMENMTFAAVQSRKKYLRRTGIPFMHFPDKKRCLAYADFCIKRLDIHCRSAFQKAGELSGGNQQKVCIAAALAMKPQILFVNDPTRGIDVEAKESILKLLIQAHKKQNMTLIVASGELDELKRICDRIAVIYNGRLFDILSPDRDDNDFVLACSGIRPEGSKVAEEREGQLTI